MKRILTPALLTTGIGFSGLTLAAGGDSLETATQSANLNGAVTVPMVNMSGNGFVVIHESNAAGKPIAPSSVGFTRVTAGEHHDVTVVLNRPAEPGEKLYAMLHHDTGKAGVYEFGPGSTNVDTPVVVNGKVAIKPFMIQGSMVYDSMKKDSM